MKTPNKLIRYLAIPRGMNSIYGHILQQAQLRIDDNLPASAAVTVTQNGVMQLIWNSRDMSPKPLPYQVLVLIHEAAHLSLCHIPRMLRILAPYTNDPNKNTYYKIAQISTDLAVNSLVVQPMLTTPTFNAFKEIIFASWMFPSFYSLPNGKSFEWYFNELIKKYDKNEFKLPSLKPGSSSSGGGAIPTYSSGAPIDQNTIKEFEIGDDVMLSDILGEGSATIARTIRVAETTSEQILENAIKAVERSRGTVPLHIKQDLEYLQTEPTVPWNVILRDYIKTEISAQIKESTLNPNVGLLHLIPHGLEPYPGYCLNFSFNIAFLMDSSGSITNKQYKLALNELGNILDAEQNIHLHYIVFDAKVQEELVFTTENSDDLRKHNITTRVASGGTDFLPPFKVAFGVGDSSDYDYKCAKPEGVKQKRPDLVIIFTDGYAPLKRPYGPYPDYINDTIKVIWILTKHYDKKVDEIASRKVMICE